MLITSNARINIFLLVLLLIILHDSLSDYYLIYPKIFILSINIAEQLFIKMIKPLVFVLIAILAVNVIIVASESKCSPWQGPVSIIKKYKYVLMPEIFFV